MGLLAAVAACVVKAGLQPIRSRNVLQTKSLLPMNANANTAWDNLLLDLDVFGRIPLHDGRSPVRAIWRLRLLSHPTVLQT